MEPDPELMRSCRRRAPAWPWPPRVMAREALSRPLPCRCCVEAAPALCWLCGRPHTMSTSSTCTVQGRWDSLDASRGPSSPTRSTPCHWCSTTWRTLARGPRRMAWRSGVGARGGSSSVAAPLRRVRARQPADAAELGTILGRPIRAVPNGVAPSRRARVRRWTRSRICFVGALDYAPNIESATMLVRDVLPIVRRQVPEATVVLAGRAARPEVRALAGAHVQVLSDVPDVMATYASSAVAAFPGGQGRGTRNSVLEALRAGVPVVASQVSARGVGRGPHLRMAGSAAEVAHELTRAADAAADVLLRRQAAADYGAALPTWDTVAAEYLAVLAAAAAQRHGPAGRRRAGEGDVRRGRAPWCRPVGQGGP